jgi:hypothetical protein
MARKGTEKFHTVVTPNRTLKIRLADEVLIYDAELSAISPRVLFCGLVGVWAIIPIYPSISIGNMKFVQHIKEIFLVEKSGQRNFPKNFLHCGLVHRSLDIQSKSLVPYR